MAITDPIPRERAEEISERARAVPGVARLHGGSFGEVALLYPGGRVKGLSLVDGEDGGRLEVHVVAALDATGSLAELASGVRDAVSGVADGRPVDVIIADAVPGPGA